MRKKFLRILSSALLIVMLFILFPTSGTAVSAEAKEIREKIVSTYEASLRGSHRYTFEGYCGTMVTWYLYNMGITKELMFGDGNLQFDIYRNMEYTSGDYRVRAYPAEKYTIAQALNAITENGTVDAYNILIGFESTVTDTGKQYGHAAVIHAVLDGVVYFSESFPTITKKGYYPEGVPIALTIDEFEEFYSPWSVFEGIIHFDHGTYAESCTYYPSYLVAQTGTETAMYSEPCTASVDERSEELQTVDAGSEIQVIGLYMNSEGEYWYQAEYGQQTGYIRADDTRVVSLCYDDVTIDGIDAPTQLKEGEPFFIKGQISSDHNVICSVRAQVLSYEDNSFSHEIITTTSLDANSYSLYCSRISNELTFRLLEKGLYRYELAAVFGNYYYEDGCLQTEWKTERLWISDFKVV